MPLPPLSDSTCADLAWNSDGAPVSRLSKQAYFNGVSGLDESRHAFIEANDLPKRWRELLAHGQFTIAETGFGAGLNFLNAWHAWEQYATAGATLHFISVERYPLRHPDLKRALQLWPDLQEKAAQLLDQYPPVNARGFHRLHFGRIRLTLIFADAAFGLEQLLPQVAPGPRVQQLDCAWVPQRRRACAVDAWFLDGVSEASDSRMWTDDLFYLIAKLSDQGTTLSTISAAEAVQQGLDSAGFHVTEQRNFSGNGKMLSARFLGASRNIALSNAGAPAEEPTADRRRQPLAASWHLSAYTGETNTEVTVIGAGLAGCHTAFSLAERGFKVTLLDRANIAAGASGNPRGVVYSKFSSSPGALADFNVTALAYALRFYHQRGFFSTCGDACGVLQVAESTKEAQQYQDVAQQWRMSAEMVRWLAPDEASKVAGVPITHGGLWLSQAGWLNPAMLCRALAAHPNIHTVTQQDVAKLEYQSGRWSLYDNQNERLLSAPTVVIACADSARAFGQCSLLPSKAIRGQVSLCAPTPLSLPLNSVLCGSGYIAPAGEQAHCLGASFNLTSTATDVRWDEHQSNLAQVQALSTAFASLAVAQLDHGRASIRCTSPDYLPIVGPVPKQEQMVQRFAIYRKNLNATVDAPGDYWPGLYINIAHGSKGLTYTPICAELIASMIASEPLPLPRSLVLRVHSARLLIRDLSRSRI